MLKIVVLDGSAVMQKDLNFDLLKGLGHCVCYEHTPKDLVIERIANSDIVLTNKVIIDKYVIDASQVLSLLQYLLLDTM